MTILEAITEVHEKSGGKNGIYIPKISEKTGLDWLETRKQLTVLYKNKTIRIQDGINGKLVCLNR